jgi:hypothetical protein
MASMPISSLRRWDNETGFGDLGRRGPVDELEGVTGTTGRPSQTMNRWGLERSGNWKLRRRCARLGVWHKYCLRGKSEYSTSGSSSIPFSFAANVGSIVKRSVSRLDKRGMTEGSKNLDILKAS